MNTNHKMALSLVAILAVSIPAFYFIQETSFEFQSKPTPQDNRESLKEVVDSNNVCSIRWRSELWDMWENKTHDYKNDPIFQECSQVIEIEKYANTPYDPNPEQLQAISEYCIDSKDLVDTMGLSYSNDTHYIDTVTCEWQELERIIK